MNTAGRSYQKRKSSMVSRGDGRERHLHRSRPFTGPYTGIHTTTHNVPVHRGNTTEGLEPYTGWSRLYPDKAKEIGRQQPAPTLVESRCHHLLTSIAHCKRRTNAHAASRCQEHSKRIKQALSIIEALEDFILSANTRNTYRRFVPRAARPI